MSKSIEMSPELYNKIHDMRSELFDAEALLLFMRKPDFLMELLDADSPDVILAAMLEKAHDQVCNSVAELTCLLDPKEELYMNRSEGSTA